MRYNSVFFFKTSFAKEKNKFTESHEAKLFTYHASDTVLALYPPLLSGKKQFLFNMPHQNLFFGQTFINLTRKTVCYCTLRVLRRQNLKDI